MPRNSSGADLIIPLPGLPAVGTRTHAHHGVPSPPPPPWVASNENVCMKRRAWGHGIINETRRHLRSHHQNTSTAPHAYCRSPSLCLYSLSLSVPPLAITIDSTRRRRCISSPAEEGLYTPMGNRKLNMRSRSRRPTARYKIQGVRWWVVHRQANTTAVYMRAPCIFRTVYPPLLSRPTRHVRDQHILASPSLVFH